MDKTNNQADDQTNFTYNPEDDPKKKPAHAKPKNENKNIASQVPAEKEDEPLFNWSSANSFSDKKNFMWYLSLLAATLVVSAALYLLTKDKVTTAVILVSGLLIGVYGGKKPKVVNYQLTKYGFTVNGRYYNFGSYRSFAVIHHGKSGGVVLTPLKRFMPYMYIYFGNDMEQQITSTLTSALPKEASHNDAIDRIIRMIGF